MFKGKEEEKSYIQRKIAEYGKEYWEEEIKSFVNAKLYMSGLQYGIDNETMQNIVNELMQNGRTYVNIDWLDFYIVNACKNNGIIL